MATIPSVLSLALLIIAVTLPTLRVVDAEDTALRGSSCNLPLDPNDPLTDKCIATCLNQDSENIDSFVCDVSADWMHHVGGPKVRMHKWYPATPPKGTGVHEYVAFTKATPPCHKNGHCGGCNPKILATTGMDKNPTCRVFINAVTCSIESCQNLVDPSLSWYPAMKTLAPEQQNHLARVSGGLLLLSFACFYLCRPRSTKSPHQLE